LFGSSLGARFKEPATKLSVVHLAFTPPPHLPGMAGIVDYRTNPLTKFG
jgi:hypothetical protein